MRIVIVSSLKRRRGWTDKALMAWERFSLQNLRKKKDSYFLLFSLLAHALILLAFSSTQFAPAPVVTKVEVEYLTPTEETDLTTAEGRRLHKLKDQVVEQQKRINEEKDEKSRFLSAFDQKVLKETRAERTGEFRNTAKGGEPDEGQKDAKKTAEKEHQNTKSQLREKGELPTLKDLSPKFALTPGPKAMVTNEPGDPSQSDDYLKDVQSGLQTLLSTREFVYYSYYSRIKEALRQHWEPNVREKVKIIYRKGRTIASARDRVTQVLVVLNKQGELIRVEVINRSGVEALDNAAVEAFRDAAPFPNPPHGMVEKDGTIKIRWDFVLEA